MFYISSDADNLDIARLRRTVFEQKVISYLVFLRPVAFGQSFVNNGNSRRESGVLLGELSSFQQRNPQSLKIACANPSILRCRLFCRQHWRTPCYSEIGANIKSAQRQN